MCMFMCNTTATPLYLGELLQVEVPRHRSPLRHCACSNGVTMVKVVLQWRCNVCSAALCAPTPYAHLRHVHGGEDGDDNGDGKDGDDQHSIG
jgi:hypothetical protein